MSNYLAIATVTKALAQMLDTAVKSAVDSSGAVTQRPDVGTKAACVDIFLYQVTPNAAMRNLDLPTRNAQGQVVSRPTSALDLHYLMSFYGDDSKFEPQRMLGAVVRSLLAEPGLTRDRILAVSKDDNGDKMSGSNLADAVEQVKFTPQSLTLEELSRIWSIFYQVPYVLSISYTATVVTIESEEPVLPTQPVLQRGPNDSGFQTQVGPFPQLDSWHVGEGTDDDARLRMPSYPSARLGTILTLQGQNLGGAGLTVRIVNPPLQALSAQRIAQHLTPDYANLAELDLPATLLPGRPGQLKISIPNATAPEAALWVAGFYFVSVEIMVAGATRSTNALPLPFAPQFAANPTVAPAGDGSGDQIVTVQPAPNVLAVQQAILSLPDRDVTASSPRNDTDPLKFTIANPPTGPVVVRLRVDGVDNLTFKGQTGPPKLVLAQQIAQFP